MTEQQVITAFVAMCRQSINPESFSNLAGDIVPQLENNRRDLSREVEVPDNCGICGKPLAGQPTYLDEECGTCCYIHSGHLSSCAVNNGPAEDTGPCDCRHDADGYGCGIAESFTCSSCGELFAGGPCNVQGECTRCAVSDHERGE